MFTNDQKYAIMLGLTDDTKTDKVLSIVSEILDKRLSFFEPTKKLTLKDMFNNPVSNITSLISIYDINKPDGYELDTKELFDLKWSDILPGDLILINDCPVVDDLTNFTNFMIPYKSLLDLESEMEKDGRCFHNLMCDISNNIRKINIMERIIDEGVLIFNYDISKKLYKMYIEILIKLVYIGSIYNDMEVIRDYINNVNDIILEEYKNDYGIGFSIPDGYDRTPILNRFDYDLNHDPKIIIKMDNSVVEQDGRIFISECGNGKEIVLLETTIKKLFGEENWRNINHGFSLRSSSIAFKYFKEYLQEKYPESVLNEDDGEFEIYEYLNKDGDLVIDVGPRKYNIHYLYRNWNITDKYYMIYDDGEIQYRCGDGDFNYIKMERKDLLSIVNILKGYPYE